MTMALVVSFALVGCTNTAETLPEPIASVEPQFSFFPEGSASQNQPIFENVLEATGAGKPEHKLSNSIALLVEAGFDIEDITHTKVESKIGEPANSVSLAIVFNGECLIAQFSASWLTTEIAEPTVSGCLIGDVEKAVLEAN